MAISASMNRGIVLLLLSSTLPAAAAKVLPVLNQPLKDFRTAAGTSAKTIDLSKNFGTEQVDDQAVRFTSQFTTSSGAIAIDMALFSNRTPVSRTNFLKYVSDGDYVKSFIHRSVPGFVIQGGGFRLSASNSIESVPTDAPIVNEFGISNTYGTVSMAKLGGDPNSATSQWFISIGDNSANLDNQNGGFAVFGRVTKTTMPNAQTFGDGVTFPVVSYTSINSAFGALPVFHNHTPAGLYPNELELFPSVGLVPLTAADAGESTALNYSIVSVTSNAIATATLNGSTLTVTPSATATGAASVVVRATDSAGNTVDDTVVVSLGQTYAAWRATAFSGADATNDAISGPNADPDGDGVPNLERYIHGLPAGPAAKPPVTCTDVVTGGSHSPRFTFAFRNDIAGASYTLEKTTTLSDPGSWTGVPLTEVSRTTLSTIDTVTIQPSEPVASMPAFYRVKFAID